MGQKSILALALAIITAAIAFAGLGANAFADTGGPGVAHPGFVVQSR